MKLSRCICGREAKIWAGQYGDELRTIECNCGISTLAWWNGNKCAANWNTIQREKRKVEAANTASNNSVTQAAETKSTASATL